MIQASSGNVFADLDLEDSERLLAEAELTQHNCDIMAERKLTRTKAATVLDIDREQVSAPIRDRLDEFTIDRLFRFLRAPGRDVEIIIRPARRAAEAGTRVVAA